MPCGDLPHTIITMQILNGLFCRIPLDVSVAALLTKIVPPLRDIRVTALIKSFSALAPNASLGTKKPQSVCTVPDLYHIRIMKNTLVITVGKGRNDLDEHD